MAEVDADILDDVQEKLRKVATGHSCARLSSQEAKTLHNELARLRTDMRSNAERLHYHADRLIQASFRPLVSPSAPRTHGPTLVEIAAERDALRSRVAELEHERDAVRATRRSELAQAFAAAMLAEHREDNLPWDEIMRRAFDAADVFLATAKESK